MISSTELFHYFCNTTKGFLFSEGEQKAACEKFSGNEHEKRVKTLIQSVHSMALKKSMQTARLTSAGFAQEDWVQQAIITMFECCKAYDGTRPFDNYVRFMVAKKMADVQRSFLRKNPPTDAMRLRLYKEIKKIQGNSQAMQKLATENGCTTEDLEEIFASGVGNRTFTGENHDAVSTSPFVANMSTPEKEAEHNEMKKILLQCIGALGKIEQRIFRLHEMNNLSLRAIFDHIAYDRSFATFKRWYKDSIYESVKRCVFSQY